MTEPACVKLVAIPAVVGMWATALWRVALAVLISVSAWQVYNLRNLPSWTERQVTREADATRTAVDAAIKREADATRTAALSAIGDTRKELLGEVAALRTDVMSRADATLQVADTSAFLALQTQASDTTGGGTSGTNDVRTTIWALCLR